MVHSFIELFICHGKAVIHEGGLHKPVDEGKIGVWKSKLKTKKKKQKKPRASSPITSWQMEEENVEVMTDFSLPGL